MSAAIEIRVPGDKSLSHRSLIFAALATGTSRIRGILLSADVQSTAAVLRALGVAVPALGEDIAIASNGSRALTAPAIGLGAKMSERNSPRHCQIKKHPARAANGRATA